MIKKKLDWKNLKDEYCPACYQELEETLGWYRCTSCPYRITKTRFDEILEEMEKESDLDIVDIYK